MFPLKETEATTVEASFQSLEHPNLKVSSLKPYHFVKLSVCKHNGRDFSRDENLNFQLPSSCNCSYTEFLYT